MTSTETSRPLEITETADVLPIVHHCFGHIPSQSLVLIGLAEGSSKAHLRVDLDSVVGMPDDTAHQFAQWLCHDPKARPEAVAVMLLDQQQAYTQEELDALCLNLEATFALRDIRIAAEHRVTSDRYEQETQRVLNTHFGLTNPSLTPTREAQRWISTATAPSFTDELLNTLVSRCSTSAVDLLLRADEPNWQAIEELDDALHAVLPPNGNSDRDTVIGLKALICHAQGRNSLACAFLNHAEDPNHSVISWAGAITQNVHRFALRQGTSYQHWRRQQNR